MPNFNSATVLGNCVQKSELRHVPSGAAVCSITMAINHQYRDDAGKLKEDTTYVDVTLWGKLAEVCAQYVQIGDPIFIQGRLRTESWDDKQTGKKRSKLLVVAENLQLISSRTKDAREPAAPKAPSPGATRGDPDLDTEPDDIPF